MKKNGFTLVELLVVITLLGLIIGLAVPNFQRIIKQTKQKTYDSLEKALKTSATNYLMNHLDFLPPQGTALGVSAETLIKEGFLESLEDPDQQGSKCDQNSYVVITQGTGGNGLNLDMHYAPCLICAKYRGASCQTRPSLMK